MHFKSSVAVKQQMPNVLCERCDYSKCRTQCLECSKFVCGGCRFTWKDGYVCRFCLSRRIRPVRCTETILTRRDAVWGDRIRRALNEVYEKAGSPIGLHLYSIIGMLYTVPSVTVGQNGVLRDQYVRIGKHYYYARFFLNNQMVRQSTTRVYPMFLTPEQKESIVAKALHPDRLNKWLDRGWEDEWDHTFG